MVGIEQCSICFSLSEDSRLFSSSDKLKHIGRTLAYLVRRRTRRFGFGVVAFAGLEMAASSFLGFICSLISLATVSWGTSASQTTSFSFGNILIAFKTV
jgi:hypothetical protein